MDRLVASAAIAFLHSPMLVWLQEIWGGLGLAGAAASVATPAVVAGLLFLRREQVRALGTLAPSFDRFGAFVMVAGGLLAATGAVYQELLVLGFSLPLSVYGYLAWTRGRAVVAPLGLPIALLLFLMPLTESTAPGLAYGLQIASAEGATSLLQVLGFPTARAGVVITTGVTTNTVTQDCSGLSTLSALVLYGLVTSYVLRLNLRRSLLVLSVLLPLGLAVNAARIAFISYLLFEFGETTADGPLHNGSGYALFVFAYVVSFSLALRLAKTQTSHIPANTRTDQSPTVA
jgi:exosortase